MYVEECYYRSSIQEGFRKEALLGRPLLGTAKKVLGAGLLAGGATARVAGKAAGPAMLLGLGGLTAHEVLSGRESIGGGIGQWVLPYLLTRKLSLNRFKMDKRNLPFFSKGNLKNLGLGAGNLATGVGLFEAGSRLGGAIAPLKVRKPPESVPQIPNSTYSR